MSLIPYLPIGGTWSWRGSSRGQWYDQASPWTAFMRASGFDPLCGPDGRGFIWTTDINGANIFSRLFGGREDTVDWQAAGMNLLDWLVPPLAPDRRQRPCETHLVAHSHALQVVLFACADGLKVHNLISVGSPVRADMMAVADRARKNIAYWQHFHSDRSDRMQWLGEFGDGHRGVVRQHPLADLNIPLAGAGHSGILNDPTRFICWRDALAIVKESHGRPDYFAR